MHQARSITAWKKVFYMLPSNMNLNIKSRTVGYNNKILISNGMFNLRKNDKVNSLTPKHTPVSKAILTKVKSNKSSLQKETIAHERQPTITHEEERAALIFFLTGGFTMQFMFR